jgi:hypothetical protein
MQQSPRSRQKLDGAVRSGDGTASADTAVPLVQKFGPDEIPSAHPHEQPLDLHQRIAARAYELGCQRQFINGSELDDWLQAEKELVHSGLTS